MSANEEIVRKLVDDIHRRERRAILVRSVIAAFLAGAFMIVIAKLAWGQDRAMRYDGGPWRELWPGDQNPDPRLTSWSWWFEMWCITRWLWWLVFGRG